MKLTLKPRSPHGIRALSWAPAVFITSLFLGVSGAALGAGANGLDPKFGGDGLVRQAPGSEPSQAIVQNARGGAVVAGSGLKAYLHNGKHDRAFGHNGTAKLPIPATFTDLFTRDGDIVACGYDEQRHVLVAQFDRRGKLDPGFGEGGFVVSGVRMATRSGFPFVARCSPVPGDDVVAGFTDRVGGRAELGALRLHDDGSPASSFGDAGLATVSFAAGDGPAGKQSDATFADLAVGRRGASRGTIFLGGTLGPHARHNDIGVAALDSAGDLDPSFSGDGRKMFDAGGDEELRAMLIQGSGRGPVLGGSKDGKALLARLHLSGKNDRRFGPHGIARIPLGHGGAIGALDKGPVGDVGALANVRSAKGGKSTAVAYVNSNGRPDERFSGNGKLVFNAFQRDISGLAINITSRAFATAGVVLGKDRKSASGSRCSACAGS